MADFTISLAGHSFRIHSLFESTREYCKRYLTEEEPELQVEVLREHLAFEQQMLDQEAEEEGLRKRKFQEPFLERTAIQRAVAEFLFDRGALMLHGSTVAVDGRAYLFTAKCGTGKSTHTRLWCEAFGNRAVMVNDDKPFLKLAVDGVWACGSPWSGKHGLDTNLTAPLAGICILQRGKENQITPCASKEALPMLLHQSYCPLDREKQPAFEALVNKLAETVPLWKMECTKDIEAALVAYDAMSK
mgnify:CR=1 FL=1